MENVRWISDALIGIAYYGLPVGILLSAKARARVASRVLRDPQSQVLLLFSAFILSCGSGHFIDAFYTFHGECAATTGIKQFCNTSTAVLSLLTLAVLAPHWRAYAMAMTRPLDLLNLEQRLAVLEKPKA